MLKHFNKGQSILCVAIIVLGFMAGGHIAGHIMFGILMFVGLIALVVVLLSSLSSCTTIDSGSVGIKFHKWAANEDQQGGVLGTCKGWVWYNPFTQDIYKYETYANNCTLPAGALAG